MRKIAALLLVAALPLFAIAPEAHAQSRSQLGIGGQLGEPSGVGLTWRGAGPADAVDLLLAWSLADAAFFANAHALYDYPLSVNAITGGALRLTYGPGAFLTFDDDDARIGLSATLGLGYAFDAFDFYVRATPRLSLVPDTSGGVGGGFGVRYFL